MKRSKQELEECKRKNELGITLVALVVTIVVLLILAGITIVYVFGDNGVFGKAIQAKIATELGKIEEQAGIIYADKFLENQSGNVPDREIIDKLIENGNNIEIRNVGAGAVTGIILEPAEVSMDKSETTTIKVKLEGSEDGNIYYAVIDGKYYKINFNGSPLTIEREATEPEGNVEEPASIEVVAGYDTTLISNIEINQTEKTIKITANGTKYGNTTLTVKYGSNTAECKVTVEERESNWAEIAEMAKQIANDDSITSDSDQATAVIDGATKIIKVGDIYKLKYNGKIRRVRVLGFKHDDLVDQGVYKDGKQHEKAGISFEFYDFMTGYTYMQMNSGETNSGGWANTKMRSDLNGTGSTIGGLGANLSTKNYIKQVMKKYTPTYNVARTQTSDDFLWLLACSEVLPGKGPATTSDGDQYRFYQGLTGVDTEPCSALVKPANSTIPCGVWWLRSVQNGFGNSFHIVQDGGAIALSTAQYRLRGCSGFLHMSSS